MVKALVTKYGADPTEIDARGYTALHYAAQTENLPVVEFLVNQGADVNAAPKTRDSCRERVPRTPLYMAYRRGRNRVAEFLKLREADRIEAETKDILDLEASIRNTVEKFNGTRAPRGVEKKKWREMQLDSMFKEGAEIIRFSGRVDLADRIEAYRIPLGDAMENTPRPGGMSFSD